MSSNDTAKFNAAVPLFTATHESEPINVLNFFSNFKTKSTKMKGFCF